MDHDLKQYLDASFERMDARFEHVDARFEDVDKKFEQATENLRDTETRLLSEFRKRVRISDIRVRRVEASDAATTGCPAIME